MKLTPQILRNATRMINPEGKLTLLLRNLELTYIENLELTTDDINVIDLTNNDIGELSGVPTLSNLEVLLLGNNNISSIDENGSLPSLHSLLLINNNIRTFSELGKLRHFGQIQTLLMMGNPISTDKRYRPFLIWLLPSLKVLDCEKVKSAERTAAATLFGASFEEANALALQLMDGEDTSVEVNKEASKGERLMTTTVKKLSAEEKAKLIAELEKAESMEEIERIQTALKNGYVG